MALRVLHLVESLRPEPGRPVTSLRGLGAVLQADGIESQIVDRHTGDAADIVHIHGWGYPAADEAARVTLARGIPYVVSPHGALGAGGPRSPWARLVQSLTSARRRKVIRGAKSILALNDEEARQLERCGVDRSARVLPYGLNFDEYANGSSHERSLSVLMLGDLHPRSGCVALLKALAELGPAGNGWEVVIAGRDDGRWRPMLEAAILRKGAQERVRFEFADDIEAQRRLLASASVLAAPSLTTEFPLSVLQAAASGVPVVATTCAAPPEMNGAISVCRPRRADLGEALRSVLTLSAEERRAMGEKLRAAGRSTLDWSMLAPRWAKMYCELT